MVFGMHSLCYDVSCLVQKVYHLTRPHYFKFFAMTDTGCPCLITAIWNLGCTPFMLFPVKLLRIVETAYLIKYCCS